jgi:hypothetical protein
LLESTTGISAQQPFAVAIGKKIRFTGEFQAQANGKTHESYTKPHFHKKGGLFPYALKFFKAQ